jgi:hypothetical protein
MGLRLSPPIEKTFTLEEIDKKYGGDTHTVITIRQASQMQHEKRQDLWATMKSRFLTGEPGMEITQRFSIPELMRVEVYLTMTDCNIEDEDGKMLFTFKQDNKGRQFIAMDAGRFAEAWGKLPPDVCLAIHDKVIEVNPDWEFGPGE